MRITGGILKGRIIKCPEGIIRPAMDQMRESVFGALGMLDGRSFLDLFSGSGIISIEAVSRGSRDVELVEKDKIKIPVILQNISTAKEVPESSIRCHFISAELFLKRCRRQFDYIFCDPPFPYRFHMELIDTIAARRLLTDQGTALIHHPVEKQLPDSIEGLALTDRRAYGRSVVSIYRI